MRLSVIIPALDEHEVVGDAVEAALPGGPLEVIVADGGSLDGTAAAAEQHGARVVAAPRGRGRQMNAGAAASTGDTLLFLHADTILPDGYAAHVERVLGRRRVAAGAFELGIDAPHRALRLVEAAVNRRSRWLGMPYGDQGVFMPAAAFRRVGGYPPIEAMEDFEIVRRLRRLGRIAIAPARVRTSARRWLAGGVWRTTMLNQLCVAAWLAGVPAGRIARWRAAAASPAAVPQYP